jgi:hypothetical protein
VLAALLLLLTFIVVLTWLFATSSDAGWKMQFTFDGSPWQPRFTVWLKPFFGVTITVTGDVWPGFSSTVKVLSCNETVPSPVGVGGGVASVDVCTAELKFTPVLLAPLIVTAWLVGVIVKPDFVGVTV